MKRSEEFILKEMAGNDILVPFGSKAFDLNGIITLNETAKFLWESAEDGFNDETLKLALMNKYDIDDITAEESVKIFIDAMLENGCIVND